VTFVSRFASWRPGPENPRESPALSFTDSNFRRRLSQISKMTIQVVHDIMPVPHNAKMIFTSFRGDLNRQLSINKHRIEEGSLSPASFSLSVFNAPPALASIALGLKGGYTAIYPAGDSLAAAFACARARLEAEEGSALIFVYADEWRTDEYAALSGGPALAFALLLARDSGGAEGGAGGGFPLEDPFPGETPAEFLSRLETGAKK
jgi:hypothetical protein